MRSLNQAISFPLWGVRGVVFTPRHPYEPNQTHSTVIAVLLHRLKFL